LLDDEFVFVFDTPVAAWNEFRSARKSLIFLFFVLSLFRLYNQAIDTRHDKEGIEILVCELNSLL
jgi:hypothetical protein